MSDERIRQFSIGQMVVHKTALEVVKLNMPGDAKHMWPMPLLVIGLESDQCPGGTQFHYILSSDGGPIKHNEAALVLWDDCWPDILKAKLALRDATREYYRQLEEEETP